MPPLQWQTGTVKQIIDETYNTRRYFIQMDEVSDFKFRAGQFVTLDLPIGDRPSKRWRSYSIASAPDGTNIIELLIVLLDGGAGSTYIFQEIKVGSTFTLKGPLGLFGLPEIIEEEIFLICTGTGVAPFRSMVQDLISSNKPHKNIYLIYGCRTRKDLMYFDELRRWDSSAPGFHYIPTLSRENWEGRTGYVHPVYLEICKSKMTSENPEPPFPALFYLCGWKFMIQDARAKILEMGFSRHNIRIELYK